MTIYEAISIGKKGLWLGNRVLLPFHAHFLKVIIENEITTDFSNRSKTIEIEAYESFTSIYFLSYDDLSDVVSEFEPVKIIAVENHDDVFSINSHKKIALYLKKGHEVAIEFLPDDIIILE